jgi:hypothetical protein
MATNYPSGYFPSNMSRYISRNQIFNRELYCHQHVSQCPFRRKNCGGGGGGKFVGRENLTIILRYTQKYKRCIDLLNSSHGDKHKLQLVEKELQTTRSYQPTVYPHWLLFELEQNIFIRQQQAEIALKLMESDHNCCVQLQMGEGKSSVIVPIMCATLSDGKKCARVNVLPSIFKTNLEDLRAKFGGMLARPIFVFPFQRDLPLSETLLQAMLSQMQKCMALRGVILASPEHRMSFLLKQKQITFDENSGLRAIIPTKILSWCDEHVVDILDESDEQLRHRFQLLYPIGSPPPPP